MLAIAKIDALGVKAIHKRIASVHPRIALETVYRWRSAILAGNGIPDQNKLRLIEATADLENPITWADFAPIGVDAS